MFSQDYYQILRIPPSASLSEIRKAYRLLALEFHPDKNSSQFASDYFVAIREAYAILSDPAQRKKYDLSRFPAQPVSRRIATTPTEIRLMSEELVKRIKTSNPDRINRDRLVEDLEAVLSVYHIQLLGNNKDDQQIDLIVSDVLFCLHYTDLEDCLQLANTIRSVEGLNSNNMKSIDQFLSVYKKNYYWNRYKIWVALFIALATCCFIYLAKK